MVDLFAGSGALGLEALSRGAAQATFVDAAEASVAVIRRNLGELGWADRATVVKSDAVRWVGGREVRGVVLLDPPYAGRALDDVLRALDRAALAGTVVVAEHGRGRLLPDLGRLRARTARRYGDTALTIFEVPA